MEVFVVPIGRDRYELYCDESSQPLADLDAGATHGWFASLRTRFSTMLREAEERRRNGAPAADGARTWAGRTGDRVMAWVAERIAEQRLLWMLRRESAVTAVHPDDLTLEQTRTLIRRMLQRDSDRHRRWLLVDTVLAVASAALVILPGPNVVFYYFAFRLVGHWLSMRGARHGLERVAWTGRASEPLTELRDVDRLDAAAREARIRDVGARLHLPHLSAFYDRVAI